MAVVEPYGGQVGAVGPKESAFVHRDGFGDVCTGTRPTRCVQDLAGARPPSVESSHHGGGWAAMMEGGGPGNRTPGCGFGDHPVCWAGMPLCRDFRRRMARCAIGARLS